MVTSTVSSVMDGISVSTSVSNETDGKSVTGSMVVSSSSWSPCGSSVAVDSSGDTGDADELPTAVSSAGLVKPGVGAAAAVVSACGAANDTVVLGKVVVVAVVVPISGVVVGLRVVVVVMSKIIAAMVVVGAGVVVVVIVVALVVSSTVEDVDGESVPMAGCCVLACTVVCAASVELDGFAKRVDSGVEAKICAKVGFVTSPTVVDATVEVVVTGADDV